MVCTTAESIASSINTDHLKAHDRQFLGEFIDALEEISQQVTIPSDEEPLIIKGVQRLQRLLEDNSFLASPSSYFEYLSHGFFKECYTFSPSLVIKFCAARNPTDSETALLDAAVEEDIQELFLPTRFLALPRNFSSTHLEVDDEDQEVFDSDTEEWMDNPDWKDNSLLTHVCIQERAIPQSVILAREPDFDEVAFDTEIDSWSDAAWRNSAESLGLDPDLELANQWRGLTGASTHWVRSLLKIYGVDYTRRFAKFCQDFPLWDLHSENVGYTINPGLGGTHLPVIMDFFSSRRPGAAAGR